MHVSISSMIWSANVASPGSGSWVLLPILNVTAKLAALGTDTKTSNLLLERLLAAPLLPERAPEPALRRSVQHGLDRAHALDKLVARDNPEADGRARHGELELAWGQLDPPDRQVPAELDLLHQVTQLLGDCVGRVEGERARNEALRLAHLPRVERQCRRAAMQDGDRRLAQVGLARKERRLALAHERLFIEFEGGLVVAPDGLQQGSVGEGHRLSVKVGGRRRHGVATRLSGVPK